MYYVFVHFSYEVTNIFFTYLLGSIYWYNRKGWFWKKFIVCINNW